MQGPPAAAVVVVGVVVVGVTGTDVVAGTVGRGGVVGDVVVVGAPLTDDPHPSITVPASGMTANTTSRLTIDRATSTASHRTAA